MHVITWPGYFLYFYFFLFFARIIRNIWGLGWWAAVFMGDTAQQEVGDGLVMTEPLHDCVVFTAVESCKLTLLENEKKKNKYKIDEEIGEAKKWEGNKKKTSEKKAND